VAAGPVRFGARRLLGWNRLDSFSGTFGQRGVEMEQRWVEKETAKSNLVDARLNRRLGAILAHGFSGLVEY
jgi:hypothetical protein